MAIEICAYANIDETTVVWRMSGRIPGCLGFSLARELLDANGRELVPKRVDVIDNWVGFADDPAAQSGAHKPSTVWPVQRFMWSDFFVPDGAQQAKYQVCPMLGTPAAPTFGEPSPWSAPVRLGTGQTPGLRAYFNRGVVSSQWVARALAEPGKDTPTALLDHSIATSGDPLREELGGHLLVQVLAELKAANAAGQEIYAALYELNDPEVIAAIEAFGKRCHLILGSGAYKPAKNGAPAVPDENAAVRSQLRPVVDLVDRIVASPHFAHNKFIVFCDGAGKPRGIQTGSTNLTVTGLCTQVNNALLVDDPVIAQTYLDRWQDLKKAGNAYPAWLAQHGSTPGRSGIDGGVSMTAWQAPVQNFVDLADARKLIQGARQGVLFLFFNPGTQGTLLNDILALDHVKLFIHGVVNADPGGKSKPILSMYDRGTEVDADPEVTLPDRLDEALSKWFDDEERGKMVTIHSKVVVVDPFGSHPVVMTGSHNLGPKASSKNDDNLLIVENAPGLAYEYAVNIMSVFEHFKYRHTLHQSQSGAQPWPGLKADDSWQDHFFAGPNFDPSRKRELDFWFGDLVPGA
ncbi:MAG: hypothetical protein JO224_09190 [Pelomonas sp.]|nr:hypothetical protein [Roseateles sp.]